MFDFGLITGPVIGGLFSFLNTWQQNKRRKNDQTHEKEMAAEHRETRRVEAECEIAVTRETFDGQAFVTSQTVGNKTALSSAALNKMLEGGKVACFFGGIIVFMLGIVDTVRGAVRPAITIYLVFACNNILTEYMQRVGMQSIESQINIVDDSVKALFTLLSVVVSWWFGDRMANKTLKLDK